MSAKQNAGMVGAGVAACAVCCAPLIGGFLAAIGLGTVLGVAVFGVVGLLIALLAIPVIVRRRHAKSAVACGAPERVEGPEWYFGFFVRSAATRFRDSVRSPHRDAESRRAVLSHVSAHVVPFSTNESQPVPAVTLEIA